MFVDWDLKEWEKRRKEEKRGGGRWIWGLKGYRKTQRSVKRRKK